MWSGRVIKYTVHQPPVKYLSVHNFKYLCFFFSFYTKWYRNIHTYNIEHVGVKKKKPSSIKRSSIILQLYFLYISRGQIFFFSFLIQYCVTERVRRFDFQRQNVKQVWWQRNSCRKPINVAEKWENLSKGCVELVLVSSEILLGFLTGSSLCGWHLVFASAAALKHNTYFK